MLATSAPIARLRSLGCKVSTVIGHDAARGEIVLSIKLPHGIPTGYQYTHGIARLEARPVENRVIVSTPGYRGPASTESRQYARAAQIDAATVLTNIADHVETYDRSGSASRQHYIETGRYLTRPHAADTFPVRRIADITTLTLDFEHSQTSPRRTLELLSYLLTGGTVVAELPDLYEGAARTVIALGILDPDGSLGPNGATYLDSLEG